MKKFFLFVAAISAALTVNAAVWDFSEDSISTVEAVNAFITSTNFTLVQKSSSEGNPYVSVDYSGLSGAEAVLDFDEAPLAIKFAYTNSGDKTEVLKFYGTYLQINRKGVKMTISCNAGDEIKIYPKSYSKACEFAVTGADKAVVALEANTDAVITVKATDSEVLFDTSAPSDGDKYKQACQIAKIEVSGSQGFDAVNANVKAQKIFENGQLVIIKNGVRYNALGAQL